MKEINVERSARVSELLEGARKAATSAFGKARNAGVAYAESVDMTLYDSADIPALVEFGRTMYAEEFGNFAALKSNFTDAATLALAGTLPITFEDTKKVKGEKVKVPVHTTGADAAQMPRDKLQKAAKALREDLGQGRASGGGRKGADQSRNDKPTTVFSLVEFKGQLAGLFGHSKGAVKTVNDCLEEYRLVAISTADYEAFQAWQEANTKPAK